MEKDNWDKTHSTKLYDKYSCLECPFVEECIDQDGYTTMDEYGYCPPELIEKDNTEG